MTYPPELKWPAFIQNDSWATHGPTGPGVSERYIFQVEVTSYKPPRKKYTVSGSVHVAITLQDEGWHGYPNYNNLTVDGDEGSRWPQGEYPPEGYDRDVAKHAVEWLNANRTVHDCRQSAWRQRRDGQEANLERARQVVDTELLELDKIDAADWKQPFAKSDVRR